MKIEHIIWYKCSEWKPAIDMIVLIDEGLASWDGHRWISRMPNSVGRRIDRDVAYWCYIPYPPIEGTGK